MSDAPHKHKQLKVALLAHTLFRNERNIRSIGWSSMYWEHSRQVADSATHAAFMEPTNSSVPKSVCEEASLANFNKCSPTAPTPHSCSIFFDKQEKDLFPKRIPEEY